MLGYNVLDNVKISILFGLLNCFILNFNKRNVSLLVKQGQEFSDPLLSLFHRDEFFGELFFQLFTDLRHRSISINIHPCMAPEPVEFDKNEFTFRRRLEQR